MKLKINQIINITMENEQKEKIPIMQAKVLGRMLGRTNCGVVFRKYLISNNNGIKFWLKQEKDQWTLWMPWQAARETIRGIITTPEGETEGKDRDEKIVVERKVIFVKNTAGNMNGIKAGAEGDYIAGRFIRRTNYEWPLFCIESWKHQNWQKQFYLGVEVKLSIA